MFVQSLYVQIFLCNYTYNFTAFGIPYLNNALIANNSLSKEQEHSRGRKPTKQLPAGCCQNLKDPHDAATAAATSPPVQNARSLSRTTAPVRSPAFPRFRRRAVHHCSEETGVSDRFTAQAPRVHREPSARRASSCRALYHTKEPPIRRISKTGGTHRHQRMKASDALFQL